MGKSLIITEKPSVAVEFAKVLQVSGRKDGYIENDKYVITWCVGHLVGAKLTNGSISIIEYKGNETQVDLTKLNFAIT